MPFVKLDCGMLNSTLWLEREAREIFITALLMAEPRELEADTPQIAVMNLDYTGWMVPAGWYGFVPAAGVGIIHRAGVAQAVGLQALIKLGDPEETSRSKEFDGRRLVRVDGGFIVLNYFKYRDRDYTAAERSKRYRERLKSQASHRNVTSVTNEVTPSRDVTRNITQAEAEYRVQKQNGNKKRATHVVPPTKPADPRVKEFLTWFQAEYRLRRHGADYFVKWDKHGALIKQLLGATELPRLKRLAQVLLTEKTDEDFIVQTDRGIEILALKFNWLSDRLAAWDAIQTRKSAN